MNWTILITVISIIASVITIYLFVRHDLLKNKQKISWKQIENIILKFIKDSEKDGFTPDVIIGIGRGGSVISGILSGNMGYVPLAHIDTSILYEDGETIVSISNDGCPSLDGLNVLLVTGELYSGEDLKLARKLVKEQNPKNLKSFSPIFYPQSVVKPEYYGIETTLKIKAPWRIHDIYTKRC